MDWHSTPPLSYITTVHYMSGNGYELYGLFYLPASLLLGHADVYVYDLPTPGNLELAIWTHDGQSRLVDATISVTIPGLQVWHLGSPVPLPQAFYYVGLKVRTPGSTIRVTVASLSQMQHYTTHRYIGTHPWAALRMDNVANPLPATFLPLMITGGSYAPNLRLRI